MRFYLDASFLVALLVDEAGSSAADRWWSVQYGESIIGDFAAMEVAAVISRGLRTRRFTDVQARMALADFDRLREACDSFCPGASAFTLAEALVRDFAAKLLAPDALHLASTIRADAALVTFDDRLADAARGRGVEVVNLAAT